MGVIAVTMAMVTARVDAERKREAEMVLKRHGLTYSDVIRDLTNYLADTGEPGIRADYVGFGAGGRLAIIEMFTELPAVEGIADEEIVESAQVNHGEGCSTPYPVGPVNANRPFHQADLLTRCVRRGAEMLVCVASLNDVYYVCRH